MKNTYKFLFSCLIFSFFILIAFGSSESNNSSETETNTEINNDENTSNIDEDNIIEEDYTESSSNDEDYYSSTKCSNCGMGKYNSEGFCNMCSSASPSRVEKSYESQYESCLGCNATGWRGDEICPICEGKGKYMPY